MTTETHACTCTAELATIEALRAERDHLQAMLDNAADEGVEAAMDTVPLDALLEAVQAFIGAGQRIVIDRNSVRIDALGNRFSCCAEEAIDVLAAAAKLSIYRVQ